MKLTGYGLREWGGSGLVALALVALGICLFRKGCPVTGAVLVVVPTLLWLAIAAFFRVPARVIPQDEALIVSPADGVISDIEVVRDHGIELFSDQELLRVGIFLSVLDVHVNRAPCSFSVEYKNYKEGKFLDARSPECKKVNESLVIAGTGRAKGREFPMAVRQISGAIARRIVCDIEPGASIEKGEIYGMIKFGSRTELYLPRDKWIALEVNNGDKVRSGTSPIARITE